MNGGNLRWQPIFNLYKSFSLCLRLTISIVVVTLKVIAILKKIVKKYFLTSGKGFVEGFVSDRVRDLIWGFIGTTSKNFFKSLQSTSIIWGLIGTTTEKLNGIINGYINGYTIYDVIFYFAISTETSIAISKIFTMIIIIIINTIFTIISTLIDSCSREPIWDFIWATFLCRVPFLEI